MSQNTQLIFGAAKEIITPAERTTMIGFGTVFGVPFSDIHDDLYARTLLLEDPASGSQVLLIAMDLLFHDDSLPKALRQYASETYGVDPNNLHVSYTHTHFGPAVKGYDFTWYKESYEAFLFDRICRCIDRAFLCRRKGCMKFSFVSGDWNVSRRLPRNGIIDFAPSPDGERDPNLYLLKLEDETGKMRALLTSFACHPSNLGGIHNLSSEYPGRLCQRIEGEFYGCTALFFQGFGSDAKLKKGMKTSRFAAMTYDECDEVANAMLTRVKTQLVSGSWQTLPIHLGSRVFQLKLPLEVYDKSYYEEFANDYGNRRSRPDEEQNTKNPGIKENTGLNSCRLHWACADFVLENYDTLPDYLPLNCGAVRINENFYILSMGGEPGINIQTVLRQHFADKQLLCFGYNDAIAYVPSDKMVAEGGYEAADRSVNEYRLKGRILPGVDEIYRKGYTQAIEEM